MISIITVGMNHREHIEALYGSLYGEGRPDAEIEAVYVDNCSRDGSAEWVRESYPQVKVLVNAEPSGFGENNNRGVMASRGEYIGIVNPDIVVKEGSIDSIMNKAKGMITVSVVTYRTDAEELRKCFDSLRSDRVSRVYVVDNSRQEYLEEFCRGRDRVEYIPSGNVGYGAAHNKAIRKAIAGGSRYHLVLNSDVHFEPEALGKLAEYMDGREDVGMVQPNVVYPDGRMQYTCRLLPTPGDLIFRRFLPGWMSSARDRRYMLKMFDHRRELDVPYHQGSFMFFRVSCLEEVGLFDERFFMYPEDIDITRRMHRAYRTMYWPGVTVVHAHRAASYRSGRMLRIHMWNMCKYFTKWGWLFDRERRQWNKAVLAELGY